MTGPIWIDPCQHTMAIAVGRAHPGIPCGCRFERHGEDTDHLCFCGARWIHDLAAGVYELPIRHERG